MNEMQLFQYQTKPVRTINRDGQVWFVAKDVCEVLELARPSDGISGLEDSDKDTAVIDRTLGGSQVMSIISESGVYSLVFKSRKPQALKFQRWVTSEVLPSIREMAKTSIRKLIQWSDEADEADEESKYTYFIRCQSFIKIGKTSDIRKRLISLQTGNPFEITLIGYLNGDKEKQIHELFFEFHHKNEWFYLSQEIIDYVGENCEMPNF